MSKEKYRAELLNKRNSLLPSIQSGKSTLLCHHLITWLQNDTPFQCIAIYLATGSEINLTPCIHQLLSSNNFEIYAPRFCSKTNQYRLNKLTDLDSLKPGKYNISEPSASAPLLTHLNEIDVWLVPGVAFDKKGSRLGYGKGIYDRLLENTDGLKVGCTFASQIIRQLPNEPHDIQMTHLVTEKGIIEIRPSK